MENHFAGFCGSYETVILLPTLCGAVDEELFHPKRFAVDDVFDHLRIRLARFCAGTATHKLDIDDGRLYSDVFTAIDKRSHSKPHTEKQDEKPKITPTVPTQPSTR